MNIIKETIDIYVDGSFNDLKEEASWAYIVVKEGTVLYKDRGTLEGEINKGRQVGGELRAVIEGIEYCKKNNKQCNIYFDYNGIFKWVADLFGKKPWKTKRFYTKDYRNYIINNKEYIKSFVKVRSHTGNKFNELVNELANNTESLVFNLV